MPYIALARQWRPRSFETLLGQEVCKQALSNALNQQRLHHAYLFTGTRGVGKTSIARLFAKALSCEQGISSSPCLSCEACQAIEQGRFTDLIEIDGASKTKVEDTRELLENVHYAPVQGRFKIYLIDEVHMLSQHSFNALLKTLEEPPAHVKFLFATTDPQKLPVTILSRCLPFHLKPLSIELIQQQFEIILKHESLQAEPEALTLIAKAAEGSMRDGLSLLEQALACMTNDTLTAASVKTILGYTSQDYALQILQGLTQADRLFEISREIAKEGGYYQHVLEMLLSHLHQLSLLQQLSANSPLATPIQELHALKAEFAPETLQLFYEIVLKGLDHLKRVPSLLMGFEMTLLRLLAFQPTGTPKYPASSPSSVAQSEQPQSPPKQLAPTIPQHSSTKPVATDNWSQLIQALRLTGPTLNAAEHAEFVSQIDNIITLNISEPHRTLFAPTTLKRLETALSDHFQKPIKVNLQTKSNPQSPAQLKQDKQKQTEHAVKASMHTDPVLNTLQTQFQAEVLTTTSET